MKRTFTGSQSGFTLIEVLVALTLFSIVSALMAPAFIFHTKTNSAAEEKNGAMATAQQALEDLRTQNPTDMASSGTTTQTLSAGGRDYTVATTLCKNSSYCTTNSRHVTIGVDYRGKTIYTVQTVFAKLR